MIFVHTWQFFLSHTQQVVQATEQQLYLVAIPMILAIVIAIPLTILSTRVKALYGPVIWFANAMQTIPSLALLALMIAIGMGIGTVPAVIALFLYALMPIVRNTYVGIQGVDDGVKDAARGMGVTTWQMLFIVELPLALRVIIAGVRSALVATVGFATLASLIGAGGLGNLIMEGMGMASNSIVLAGTVPAIILAFLADGIMGLIERALTPRGLKVS
ncbi:ABC transporter permease [Sulfobacillus harzensis]|uniref:ABC transporter permease n=1 Tax=Sulfobacillus harzensis TaxID=2729629 RepID=A0A7Y0L2T6_9FIRM|nr:ABC transporter permease [Sulfobacillus harzensis]NMP21360.1 ABC transporter permease [Sulfobacillus harzensis]